MKSIIYLLIVRLAVISIPASAQTDSAFLSHATAILKNQPATEKVYLHLDKPNYDFGDTIWFKAYTVIGQHHQLSALSGVLYVELISPKDSLLTRQILPLTSGVAWSDIPLPHTLKQGSYRVRAYTNWMRNAGPDYFYSQKITIGGIPPPVNEGTQNVVEKTDVQFFPEGGQLVTGIRSRIAFKAINSKGVGESIKGIIEDNDGNVVTDFSTEHLGMGVFAFTPQSGKTYKAKISDAGEAGFTVDLPKALEEGYTLAISNSRPDSIFIKVAVNEKMLNEQKNGLFYIIAQSAVKAYYTSQGKLDGLVYTAKVEKSRFPSGITQFTLFSQNGEPLAERIAFIQSNDTLKLNITAAANSYATRQPIKMSLDAKDHNNNTIAGSFSVAVIDESNTGIDEAAESTIINNLLLTSDLKGYIEQPNYYFINQNEQTRADLDVLMLTQGYRRFEWKQVLNNTATSIKYQPERSLELTGTLKTPSGKPVPKGKVTLMASKGNLFRDTIADTEGHFKFAGLYLADTTTILLKARKENKNDNVRITITRPDFPALIAANNVNSELNQLPQQAASIMQKKYTDYLEAQKQDFAKKGILLKQVNIHGYRPPKPPELTHSSNLNGAGNANQVIMGDRLNGCIALSDCLQGKVFGVIFASDGTPHNTRGPVPPKMVVIVDGIIMDGNHLNDLNASDIYSIEVLRSGAYLAIYGSDAPGGALVITMKRGGEDSKRLTDKPPLGLITFPFIGYYKARSFYSPKYTGPKTAAQKPDERSTIYWNPNILTDKDGKATFEYFNADTKGTYRVVVEGIDDNGNLGRQVYRYKVE